MGTRIDSSTWASRMGESMEDLHNLNIIALFSRRRVAEVQSFISSICWTLGMGRHLTRARLKLAFASSRQLWPCPFVVT